jgi:hypothetical protein
MSHTMHGKWSEFGTPHKGRSCTGTEDIEEPNHLCEMCESVWVRFVHTMVHPDYAGELSVGCICAEHMSEDYVNPRRRENELKRKARQQKARAAARHVPALRPQPVLGSTPPRHLNGSLPPGWFMAAPGQLRTIIDGYEITVGRDRQLYWSTWQRVGGSFWAPGYCRAQTIEEVVQFAFNTVARMKK